MKELEKLTQQQLKNILMDVTMMCNDSENINVGDVVEEIKKQVLTTILQR